MFHFFANSDYKYLTPYVTNWLRLRRFGTSTHQIQSVMLWFQSLHNVILRSQHVSITASEHVHLLVSKFRPGMYRQVRFRDLDHASHALRCEFVRVHVQHLSTLLVLSFEHDPFYGDRIV